MADDRLGDREPIRSSSIDGVTVFWTPSASRVHGSLQFRSGRADEPFVKMGISHLVEHLALFPIGQRPYATNGFVDHARTVFHATGTVSEVGGYLAEVTRNLGAVPIERLPGESQILRTEAGARTPTIGERLLWLRCGAGGFGALAMNEHGLGSLDGADVEQWVAERFSADNAVAWISAEPPTDLRFSLRLGQRVPPIELQPIDELILPAWAPSRLPGVALGVVVPRASPVTMGLRILTQRLQQRLRFELAKCYEVSLAYLPLNGSVGHGSLFASCTDADVPIVRDAFAEVVDSFLASGPTQAELDADVAGFRRSLDDPDAVLGELDRRVYNSLLGHPADTPSELFAEMREVTPSTSREACVRAFASAIFAGPSDEPPGAGGWHAYPSWSSRAVSGRRYDVVSRRYPWSKAGAQLIVGDDGVSWISVDGRPITVRFDACAGVVSEPGVRVLWGRDGFNVRVAAAEWRAGGDAVARVDRAVPKDRVVWA